MQGCNSAECPTDRSWRSPTPASRAAALPHARERQTTPRHANRRRCSAKPIDDSRLLVVVGPRKRRRMIGVVAIADVSALRYQTLDHGQISLERRAMQRCSIVDASHVPVAVFLQQEVDGRRTLREHMRTTSRGRRHPRAAISFPLRRGTREQAVHHRRRAGVADRSAPGRRQRIDPGVPRARSSSRRRGARGSPAKGRGSHHSVRSSRAPYCSSTSINGPATLASLACLLVTTSPMVSAGCEAIVDAFTSAPASSSVFAMSALFAGRGGRCAPAGPGWDCQPHAAVRSRR